MIRALLIACGLIAAALPALAQGTLQDVLQAHRAEVESPSRATVGTVLDALDDSDLPGVATFLERWQDRAVWVRASDGLFFYAEEQDDGSYALLDISTEEPVGTAAASEISEIRPNGGVRREIASALVEFQLADPDPARRRAAVTAIARAMEPEQLAPLAASVEDEPDAALRAQKERLARMLTALYGDTPEARIAAIESFAGETAVDARAILNRIVATRREAAAALPEDANIARELRPGGAIAEDEAYEMLVAEELAPPRVPAGDVLAALTANLADGVVAGVPVETLGDPDARDRAYAALAEAGLVQPRLTDDGIAEALASHAFWDEYVEPDPAITDAAERALSATELKVAAAQSADLALDALSLASIYFLAAIGLAITFGVMGVINMAHGEFIMMGAYTGYVVQQWGWVPNYTVAILIALPLAFAVTFAAGVAMERLVIRWLYHRPLETLLATFGISIALQQMAKNIFGTQARPLTSPSWLGGSWEPSDLISISYIRIAIFALALVFLAVLLFILKRTRLGLEVRAVTQNPGMAASMGINPGRINMLTFGLGSGIAGIAGVAIGLYAQVTSEMGSGYIVQSFMTVVVGGVGNVWGTLAGATMIGGLQKGIEWFNPSNTLAAQTYMILFIILFIQFRPKGIVALKGRAAGD
ncbi:urea ABC transporter permease subunit UrtB [Wenxinia marina]|uniref:Amino acid/amide ABC transporter membrane protein 1, HAAT family n=1 Tax=Wenxinia marina DSM 24838 TaxID=1123501 RepID=A0A0D0QBY1_9RHOB|nr:urea ABC transporter permease subunit UrtB [Wenxinia marina]KIQ68463.1 amino acid/amide ABC transporter membrane protein 1, HAAT family [Wenxinia marina DSM 24838]GGL65974.1 branched-chain amino acid ABC transporter permease [Wenxinia marina]